MEDDSPVVLTSGSEFYVVMDRIVKTVKETTGVNIKFFPLSVAKTWVLLFYVRQPERRLALLKTPNVRTALKLNSVDDERLVDLSERYADEHLRAKLDLTKEGFDYVTKNYLTCDSSWFDVPSTSIARFEEFLTDLNVAFEADKAAKECVLWEKLVFALKLYKTPAGSFKDVILWYGSYNKKFVEAKKTLLELHPELPSHVIEFVIIAMHDIPR